MSDVKVTAVNVLTDWMQAAKPPAVNDLVRAVKTIRTDMHQELVNYLRKKFPQQYVPQCTSDLEGKNLKMEILFDHP